MVDGGSLLPDVDGVVVASVQRLERLEDGTRLVHVLTAPQWVGICPQGWGALDRVERLGVYRSA